MDAINKVKTSVFGAPSAKDKTVDAAVVAKDKTVDTAVAAKDGGEGFVQTTMKQAGAVGESVCQTAQAGTQKTGEVLSSAGEQVNKMAQGATDAVKNTFAAK